MKSKPFKAPPKLPRKSQSTRVAKASGEGPTGSAGYFDNGRGAPKRIV